jgi:HNH endonuclease
LVRSTRADAVATVQTENEWLDFTRGKSVRQIEHVIAGAQPGDTPDSVPPPGPRRLILRFEVAPETFALFREATCRLRRETNTRFDDDALLLAMARCVLGGPTDGGRTSYQVSLSVCPACRRGAQHASGELVPVGAEIVAMAHCDGQHLGVVNAPANDLVGEPVSGCCDAHVGAGANTHEGAHAHVDAPPKAHVHAYARAKQTIPPRLRRAVLLRDHRCCRVPGCRNSRFLDVHHIQPRSRGGRNEAGNLITLCGAHHRAIHRGDLALESTAGGLRGATPAQARIATTGCILAARIAGSAPPSTPTAAATPTAMRSAGSEGRKWKATS